MTTPLVVGLYQRTTRFSRHVRGFAAWTLAALTLLWVPSAFAEDVQSGSVYVQPGTPPASNDELYFIYYEDPATGVTTAPQIVSNPNELVEPLFYPDVGGAPAPAPAPEGETFRTSSSTSSFRIQVNGQQHGFENKK